MAPLWAPRRGLGDAGRVVAACVGGAAMLALALRAPPGSGRFAALAGLAAAIWLAGASPIAQLRDARARDALRGLVWGTGLAVAALLLAAPAAALMDGDVERIAAYSEQGRRPVMFLVVAASAVAEELMFRGALPAVLPRFPLTLGTGAYVAAAACTGSLTLTVSAAVFGAAAAVVRRRGTVVAPVVMHGAFSLIVLTGLPAIVGSGG